MQESNTDHVDLVNEPGAQTLGGEAFEGVGVDEFVVVENLLDMAPMLQL